MSTDFHLSTHLSRNSEQSFIMAHPWPAWQEYTCVGDASHDEDFAKAKNAIIDEYGTEALRQSWLKVCSRLAVITQEIASKGSDIIPIFDSNQILGDGFTQQQKNVARTTGAFVCRSTISRTEATDLYTDLKAYLGDNEGRIPAWPKESPSMLMLYDSPVQNRLRTHPRHLDLQRELNTLWHDSTGETSPEPLVYLDGLRDRMPGQEFLGLGPHIDAGSLARWVDPAYRHVYHDVFSGRPEQLDIYDLGVRKDAVQDLFPGIAHSSVLRTFQGWTAFTPTCSGQGTILVYPNASWAIAYVILRPLFCAPVDPDHIMDASKWTIDRTSAWFPGTVKAESQRLSRSSHPHLRLEDCMVAMPPIEPGDTVWWHADVSSDKCPSRKAVHCADQVQVCHAVDTRHDGTQNAAVAYIAACPTTPINKAYVRRQLTAILQGQRAPDYVEAGDTLDERTLKGHRGLEDVGGMGRRAFGFEIEAH